MNSSVNGIFTITYGIVKLFIRPNSAKIDTGTGPVILEYIMYIFGSLENEAITNPIAHQGN